MSARERKIPWLVFYVKPRHEKTVAAALGGKGYESYVPVVSRRYDHGKRAELPLFPGYVFGRVPKVNLLHVMVTPGIFSVVGNGKEPLPVPDHEIDRVRTIIASGLRTEEWPYISPGQEVTVVFGPLRGVSGIVIEAADQEWLVISVNLLKRSVAVKLDRRVIEATHLRGPAPFEDFPDANVSDSLEYTESSPPGAG